MADRPIIFSSPMVRALLNGRKTQTRRLFKRERPDPASGDRLWVKETWRAWTMHDKEKPVDLPRDLSVQYAADDALQLKWDSRTRSPIHMPRWASRLTLIVEQVRIERLQDISEDDARSEGMVEALDGWAVDTYGSYWGNSAVNAFRLLWDGIHDKPGERWEDNPWIVALTFRVIRGNIDQLAKEVA